MTVIWFTRVIRVIVDQLRLRGVTRVIRVTGLLGLVRLLGLQKGVIVMKL